MFSATEDVGLLPVVSPTTESGSTTVSEWAWVAAPSTTVSDIPEYWGLVTIAVSPDSETVALLSQKNISFRPQAEPRINTRSKILRQLLRMNEIVADGGDGDRDGE